MNLDMATRSNTSGLKIGEKTTEFQLHKSLLPVANTKRIIDYTERRLCLFVKRISDPQQRETLINLLDKYCKGEVAVAWKAGKPVWINVTKD